ncbi:MAG TPA: CDP-diacylglycerol--serine O-phosphatidyltransferase [Bacteroidales bacterium]|nr:CDP-diacylglycerol--serine O-phosphatidyltransferase [Bacteroidales bacterium]
MKHIPNLITSLNLVSGFIAVIFAARGDIISASWLIVAAMIFDFLDGFSARLLKAYSDIGKELDSLADVVSFGVAPAIIVFHLLSNTLAPESLLMKEGIGVSFLLLIPAIMPVCAALRLAKFNLDSSQSVIFKGLPTPANAIAIISLILAMNFSSSKILDLIVNSPLILLTYTIILSLLMVSKIKLFSLKIKSLEFRGNEGRYLLSCLIVLAFITSGPASLLLIIPLYIISSLIHFSMKNNLG